VQAQELKDRPLDERRRLLQAVVKVEDKRVEFVECEEVHSQETATRIEQLKTYVPSWRNLT
jgi:ATP-dependent DNA ligase